MAKYKITENGVENTYEISEDRANKLINVGLKLQLVKEVKEAKETEATKKN